MTAMPRTAWSALWLAAFAACGQGPTAIVDAAMFDARADGAAGDDAAPPDGPPLDGEADGPLAIDDAAVDGAVAIEDAAVDGAVAIEDAAVDGAVAIEDAAVDGAVVIEDAGGSDGAGPLALGCADGTREGFVDPTAFPTVAACAGAWDGEVGQAGALCAPGWQVCDGSTFAVTNITFAAAIGFPGCFAFDAAHDNYVCRPDCSAQVAAGVDTADGLDMGGVGAGCRFQFPGTASCLVGGRIDASENSGTGCRYAAGITDGVVCCASIIAER